MEHCVNPALALAEITRVARSGYIESPTWISEYFYGWDFHKWVIHFQKGKFFFTKPRRQKLLNMHYIYRHSILLRIINCLLDCIFGWHYLRIIWNKSGEGIVYKRLIFRNQYKYLRICKKTVPIDLSDLVWMKNVRIREKLQRAGTDLPGKSANG